MVDLHVQGGGLPDRRVARSEGRADYAPDARTLERRVMQGRVMAPPVAGAVEARNREVTLRCNAFDGRFAPSQAAKYFPCAAGKVLRRAQHIKERERRPDERDRRV